MISFSQQRGGAIKSIQRGVAAVNGVAAINVAIAPVDPAWTELRHLGETGSTSNYGMAGDAVMLGSSVRLANATTIAVGVSGTASVINAAVSWELTEYHPT